jgi:hypothetical protein
VGRCERGAFVAVVAIALVAGCATVVVDAKLHTQAGVTTSCRVSRKRPATNKLQLEVSVTPPCTTGDIATQVLQAGAAISPRGKSSTVVYAHSKGEVTSEPFSIPPSGTWLTVDIVLTCDRAGVTKSGADDCLFTE